MLIHRDSIRYGLYAGVIAIILALTGVFASFERNRIIAGASTLFAVEPITFTLSTFILIVLTFGTGYLTAWQARRQGIGALVVNGAAGGLLVSAALALLVIFNVNVDRREISFVFPNMGDLTATPLVFGQADVNVGLVALLAFGAVMGGLAGVSLLVGERERRFVMLAVALTVVIGLLQNQIRDVIALPDALAVTGVFAVGYIVAAAFLRNQPPRSRLGVGFIIGALVGVGLYAVATSGGLESGGILRGAGDMPRILNASLLALVATMGLVGATGALMVSASKPAHNGMVYFLTALVVLGVLDSQGRMSIDTALMTFVLFLLPMYFAPALSERAAQRFFATSLPEKRVTNRAAGIFALIVMLVAPIFMGQYITSVFDLVGLYIIMGIGLNVMVGYAGLLDLGFVASFAIGAYAMGLMTTPSLLTCGGVPPSQITPATAGEICTGIMSFWVAWPFAALTAGLTGALLGVPVLRLRGDYLAIVTLGFGEIINRLLLSSTYRDLLGGAQGISPIPQPEINVVLPVIGRVFIQFGNAINIYYLILFAVLLVGWVVYRLANTRLGRAWRSIKADEDVAEAMGIHLVNNKLLAFGISSTLAGVGGAIFGAWLQGIFPNSFTLLVSINVLSLIIIGGLGSIPGVVVGALILIGLPEVLRELQDYRLLAFGSLLVITMLLRPEGLVPPSVRRLAETVTEEEGGEQVIQAGQEAAPEVKYG